MLKQLYWTLRNYFYWQHLVGAQWRSFNLNKSKFKQNEIKEPFTIGIVTYIARYDRFFKNLINQLAAIFPDVEIVVMINGYHNPDAQKQYLKTISAQLDTFSNVKYTSFNESQGLSKLWNQIILSASAKNIFIFNDDIVISPFFRDSIIEMDKNTLTLINNSWSHFLIHKTDISEIGWFDERLTGVGNEDQDYDFRLTVRGRKARVVYMNKIKNVVFQTKDFSYAKNMRVINNKYSASNWEFLNKKWEMSELKKEGFLYSSKFRVWFNPKAKVETPNFYPEKNLL